MCIRDSLKLAARRVETRLRVGAQQPLLPLLVLHHHRRHPHFSTRRTGLLEGETAGLKCEAQHLLFALRIEIAVPQALRQFGENKEIIPGLALGCNEPIPDLEKRAEAHIAVSYTHLTLPTIYS